MIGAAGSEHDLMIVVLRHARREQGWFEGNPFSSQFSWVDVRDVAKAHILAAETPSAHGR